MSKKQKIVVLTHPAGIDFVRVKDVTGKEVASFYQNKNELDFSQFPKGVYFVQVSVNGYLFTEKLVKR